MGGLRASVLAVGEVVSRFDQFEEALRRLCVEHGVALTTDVYACLAVRNLKDGEEPLQDLDLDDMTQPRPLIRIGLL
jgi:hypothetical protein